VWTFFTLLPQIILTLLPKRPGSEKINWHKILCSCGMIKDILIILATFIASYLFIMALMFGLVRVLFLEKPDDEEVKIKAKVRPVRQANPSRQNKQYIFKHALNA
jgi:hypothetical protein